LQYRGNIVVQFPSSYNYLVYDSKLNSYIITLIYYRYILLRYPNWYKLRNLCAFDSCGCSTKDILMFNSLQHIIIMYMIPISYWLCTFWLGQLLIHMYVHCTHAQCVFRGNAWIWVLGIPCGFVAIILTATSIWWAFRGITGINALRFPYTSSIYGQMYVRKSICPCVVCLSAHI